VRAGGRTTWRADGRRTGRAVALALPSPRRALAVLLVAALAAAVDPYDLPVPGPRAVPGMPVTAHPITNLEAARPQTPGRTP